MDQRVKLSLSKRTAELVEDAQVVAVRAFGTDEDGEAMLKRAVELGQNHSALVALLWPERLDSNGHG